MGAPPLQNGSQLPCIKLCSLLSGKRPRQFVGLAWLVLSNARCGSMLKSKILTLKPFKRRSFGKGSLSEPENLHASVVPTLSCSYCCTCVLFYLAVPPMHCTTVYRLQPFDLYYLCCSWLYTCTVTLLCCSTVPGFFLSEVDR